MNKKIRIIFGYIAIWATVLNQLWLPLAVWAQEVEVGPTPTPEATPIEEVTPIPEETPPPEADQPVAETPTPTPEATPTDELTPTPTDEVTPPPEADQPLTETPTPEADDFAIETATESAQLAPIDEVILVIPKSIVGSLGQVDGGEENNDGDQGGSGVIETGQAVAVANVINLVNTNIESGTIGIYLVDQLGGNNEEKNDLNLNDVWKLSNQADGDAVQVDGSSSFGWLNMWLNQTSISNDVTVIANSGLNLIGETDEAFIITGNATALANILNIVNANFFNSKVFFGIINIDGASLGNIILPRPELFGNDGQESQGAGGGMSNIININNTSVAVANSGGNEIVGQEESTIITGDSLALVNNMTMVNVGGGGNNMFYFNLSSTGENNGQIYNWLSPGTAMDMAQFVNVFGLGMGNANGGGGQSGGLNLVDINNNVTAVANSGLNQIWGGSMAQITTGDASSIINLSNFINLNLSNNRWFYGLVNIVGNWDGNIIFAYPDLVIGLSSQAKEVKNGDGLVFEVSFFNRGYEESVDTKIELNLPTEFKYISDNSGLTLIQRGNKLSWLVDRVGQGQGGSFEIMVETQVKESILAGIIKSVWAADDVEVNTESMISTSLPESDTDNNYALVKTSIVMFDSPTENSVSNGDNNNIDENDGIDPRQAIVTIEARNNVAEFVYTGDVVTFDVDVKNESDVPAFESVLVCEIYDELGTLLKYFEIGVGEIGAYKSGKISFGLPISKDMGVGKLESMMKIYAIAINGNELESNISTTEFDVRGKSFSVGMGSGEILSEMDLGDETDFDNGTRSVNLAVYLLLFVVSAGWIYRQSKVWSVKAKKGVNLLALALFVSAVGGFVYSLVTIVARI